MTQRDSSRSSRRQAARPRRFPLGIVIGVAIAVVVAVVAVGVLRMSTSRASTTAAQPQPSQVRSSSIATSSKPPHPKPAAKKAPASAVEPTASAMGVAVAHPALNQAVPVLMYHHILPVPSNMIAISPSTFDAQMRYLHDNGYHAISMQQMQDFVLTGKRLPDKPVLITFDDGRMNQLTYGVPILKKYGFTATFFVVKKWVASSSSSFMHAAQIRQLAADGYDIESHTTNHMMLYRFHSKSTGKYETYASMKTRMWESTNGMRTWMADKLGISPVIALAYPGGGFDTYTWKLVQEAGYLLAFTTNDGYVRYKGQNQYDLPRFNTGARGTTQAHFVAVMRGAQRSKK